MQSEEGSRASRVAPAVVGAAAAVFALAVLAVGLHSDDRQILATTRATGYPELWSTSFFGRFYRPLLTTLIKASIDVFGTARWTLRALEAGLVLASVGTLVAFLRPRVSAWATTIAGLFLLASPLTFVAISPFAVGVADTIVGFSLLLAIVVCHDAESLTPRDVAALALVSVVAMLSKESGVLVTAYVAMECARRRQGWSAGTLVGLGLAYVAARSALLRGEPSFPFATGYFFHTYSASELDQTFGTNPYPLYAYNVASNLSLALVGYPSEGNLHLSWGALVRVPLFAVTLAAVVRFLRKDAVFRRYVPLVVLVLLNACVGYLYVRPRIMFTAHVAASVLVAFAVDDLASSSERGFGLSARRFLLVLVTAWSLAYVVALGRVCGHAIRQRAAPTANAEAS